MAKNIAIFILGFTSSILVHFANIIIGLAKGDDVMSGIINSFPYNIIALVGFIGAILFLLWYSKKQSKREEEKEKRSIERIKEAVKEGINEAISSIRIKYRGTKIWKITTKKMR